jgi:uncharacterized protein
MKIQVGGLSEGVHEYSFQSPPAEIGLSASFVDEVRVSAVLEKSSGEFRLKAAITAGAQWECDRCVTPFKTPLGASYLMVYVFEGGPDLDPTEMQVIPASLNVIDIAEDVRQSVELSVPLKRVCRETCRGLCPYCGTNLNDGSCACEPAPADSRWDKLKELKNNHDVR